MESFENNEFETESNDIPESPVEPMQDTAGNSEYRSGGTGHRESPYANSPYEMNHHAREYYDSPSPSPRPKKAKKPHKPIWKSVLACLLAVVLVAGGCGITAAMVNQRPVSYTHLRAHET